jgi:hypothetical protein
VREREKEKKETEKELERVIDTRQIIIVIIKFWKSERE